MVIVFHAGFPGVTTTSVIYRFCRCAVPLFFMISGWFAWSKKSKSNTWVKNKIIGHFYTFLNAFIIYFLINIVRLIRGGKSLLYLVQPRNIIALLVFNYVTPYTDVGHLWFYMSLIYIWIIYLCLNQSHSLKKACYIIVPLYTLCFIIEIRINQLSIAPFDPLYRNFLLTGFPCFMTGYCLRSISQTYSIKKMKIIMVFCFATGTVLLILERNLINYELYLSSVLLALSDLIYSFVYPGKHHTFLSRIGRDYCKAIYLWHYLVIELLEFISHYFMTNTIFSNAICIFFATLLLAFTLRKLKSYLLE